MDYADQPSEVCSIARTAGVVGDRWKLLVLRDLSNGIRRFDDLVRHLGVARDVLARRLSALVDEGMVSRVQYREPGSRTRYEYLLTAKGRDFVPVLLAMMRWGDAYLAGPEGPPVRVFHADCGAPVDVEVRCAAGHTLPGGRGTVRVFDNEEEGA